MYGPGVQEVAETPRPGMKTLSHPRGPGLRSYQFEHKIYHPLPSGNVDTELKFLRALAEEGKRVRFFNTGALGMDTWYWVTECKITEEERRDRLHNLIEGYGEVNLGNGPTVRFGDGRDGR